MLQKWTAMTAKQVAWNLNVIQVAVVYRLRRLGPSRERQGKNEPKL
jgi:hypothetical protein